MPLSSVIEFLSAQESGGTKLCHFGASETAAVIPAGQTVVFSVAPATNDYAQYKFRFFFDDVIVPGSFLVQVNQYGAVPYAATIGGGLLNQEHSYFLRITHAQPVVHNITNLTLLNQQFIGYDQFLVVATEDDYKELERRLSVYLRQAPVPGEVMASPSTGGNGDPSPDQPPWGGRYPE